MEPARHKVTDIREIKLRNRRIITGRDNTDVVIRLRMLHDTPCQARVWQDLIVFDKRTGRISELTFLLSREAAGALASMILSEYPDVAAEVGITLKEVKP